MVAAWFVVLVAACGSSDDADGADSGRSIDASTSDATADATSDASLHPDASDSGADADADAEVDAGPVVTCPTTAITEAPRPAPTTLQVVDGTLWIDAAHRAAATNWKWTVVGSSCDAVLPHPTFQIYNQTDSTAAHANLGAARTPVALETDAGPPRYVSTPGQPLIALQVEDEALDGGVDAGWSGGQIYPAFGLSGNYVAQGEFDLEGQHYVCAQDIKVAAPGVRAELCWDTVGGSNGIDGTTVSTGNDLDLHFARLQGTTCASHGWDTVCSQASTYEDCYYSAGSGCRSFSAVPPGWGYANSASSACEGWSSGRLATDSQPCTNPRMDTNNTTCDPTVSDPTNVNFCAPENINIDNPNDGDAFVVAVNDYANNGGTPTAHPHVNIYCNGTLALSAGYNPITGQTQFPALVNGGEDTTGDYWNVATVVTHVAGGVVTSCDVATIPSHHADPTRDGSTNLCVDSTHDSATPAYNYVNHDFVDHTALQGVANGSIPPAGAAADWCKH